MEHESDVSINCNRCARYSHQRIGMRSGGIGNKRTSGDHTNYGTVKIGQNSSGDLRRLAVTQDTVEDHGSMLV